MRQTLPAVLDQSIKTQEQSPSKPNSDGPKVPQLQTSELARPTGKESLKNLLGFDGSGPLPKAGSKVIQMVP